MKLPDSLAGLELGESPIGMLRTAGSCAFHDDTGERICEPVWFVLCPSRAWLVAAGTHGQWSVASAEVRLDKGWTWDAMVVGSWSAPLRAGTRGSAAALMAKWEAAPKGGVEVPAPEPVRGSERAPIARGADGVPEWIAERVPAGPEQRWLYAFETSREHAFIGRDGQIHEAPTWFAMTDQRMVIAAEGPHHDFVRQIEGLVHEERTGRRDQLVADGWPLPGALVGDRKTAAAAALSAGSGPERWAQAVEQAIDAGEPERARELVSEAFVLDHHRSSWGWIGLLALDRSPDAAVGAAGRWLSHDPELDLREAALAWSRRRKALRGEPALQDGVLSECALAEPPDGLPWPPDGPFEVFGTAAILSDRIDDGLALWAHRGDTARARQAIAATEASRGADDAWRSWSEAALRWRPEDHSAAREALDRAIALAPEPAELQWRAATWASEDGEDAIGYWDTVLPGTPPEDLEQELETWRALAEHAEGRGAWAAAAAAWSAVREAAPAEHGALVNEARIRETELDDLEGAIAALRTLAERIEQDSDPEPTHWTVWTELARLSIAVSALGEAEEALQKALEGDFLVPEAYERVLELAEPMGAERLGWWRHLQAVLTTAPDTPPRAAIPALNSEELDALHPGGVGWLDRARHSVDASDPPPRGELIRGLERIEADRWPELSAGIAALAKAVGIDPPDTYLFRGEGAWGLSAWPTEPPLVLVGHDHLKQGHALFLSPPALQFALAVEIVHLAERHPLLAFDGGLVGTSRSVYRAFGTYAGAAETVVDVVTLLPGVDQLAKIQTLVKLSKRVFTARSVIDKATGAADSTASFLGWSNDDSNSVARSFRGAAIQFRLQADRAALLLTGDFSAAIEAILRGDPELAPLHERVREEGLLAVLPELDPDARLRVAGLLGFAAGL